MPTTEEIDSMTQAICQAVKAAAPDVKFTLVFCMEEKDPEHEFAGYFGAASNMHRDEALELVNKFIQADAETYAALYPDKKETIQ